MLALRTWKAARMLRNPRISCTHRGVWEHVEWLAAGKVKLDGAIIDVGCGNGYLLRKLASVGFTNLLGADPYLANEITYPEGIRVLKRELRDIDGPFDCVMMTHSFEHMADPVDVLSQCKRITKPGGAILIAIPVSAGYSWRTYRTFWLGLDCPRHLVIPSERGMRILAQREGLITEQVAYYGRGEVLAKNEMYKKGVPLEGPGGIRSRDLRKEFGSHYAQLDKIAKASNQRGEGDIAVFVLRKPTAPAEVP
jgi:SAM-dependent methyltransferase